MNAPSPVRSNEVMGTIQARDLGDARLTDHFYVFAGTPGDVLITIESRNLNGDIDVFTAASLRPLLKFTVYAETKALITKSIYLRKREDLILRVEARSPNDDSGTYRLRFGGSFQPASESLIAEGESPATQPAASGNSPGDKKLRRVSSVGARIEEPSAPAEVVATKAEPAPAEPAAAVPVPTESEKPATAEKSIEAETPKPTAARVARSRHPARRRGATASKTATKEEDKPTANTSKNTPTEPEPENGPRLIIEMRDGTLVDRFLNTIRRVIVEHGQVIVVGKDGRIQRVQMSAVVRMSIGP